MKNRSGGREEGEVGRFYFSKVSPGREEGVGEDAARW